MQDEASTTRPLYQQLQQQQQNRTLALVRNYVQLAQLVLSEEKEKEGTFGWYLDRIRTKEAIGYSKFGLEKRKLVQIGFSEVTMTSEKGMFGFFRKFNSSMCKQQGCEIFSHQSYSYVHKEFNRFGVSLDANIQTLPFKDNIFSLDKNKEENSIRSEMRLFLGNEDERYAEELSRTFDSYFALRTWKHMRPINILISNEPSVIKEVRLHQENKRSSLDISVCWSGKCSIQATMAKKTRKLQINRDNSVPPNCVCTFDVRNKFKKSLIAELGKIVDVKVFDKKEVEWLKKCRFFIGIEDTDQEDYLTSTFFDGFSSLAFGGKQINIYRGPSNIGGFGFPSGSFLNFDMFGSPSGLGLYLKDYCLNDEIFLQFFYERMTESTISDLQNTTEKLLSKNTKTSPCKLCTAIAEMKLARYLLFKLGLQPIFNKVSEKEFKMFLAENGYQLFLSGKQIDIFWKIFDIAYGRMFRNDNEQSMWNNYEYNYVS